MKGHFAEAGNANFRAGAVIKSPGTVIVTVNCRFDEELSCHHLNSDNEIKVGGYQLFLFFRENTGLLGNVSTKELIIWERLRYWYQALVEKWDKKW